MDYVRTGNKIYVGGIYLIQQLPNGWSIAERKHAQVRKYDPIIGETYPTSWQAMERVEEMLKGERACQH